jgi:hypothetical protein
MMRAQASSIDISAARLKQIREQYEERTRAEAVAHVRVTSALSGEELLPETPVPCVDFVRHVREVLTRSRAGTGLMLLCAGVPILSDFQVAPGNHVELTAAFGIAMPDTWVTRWVDYTSRYGVAYQLPDGCVGVFFNDSTKAQCAPDGSHFYYIPRRTAETRGVRSKYTFDNYPADLQKKVLLLKHFRQSIGTDALTNLGATTGESSLPTDNWIPQPDTSEVYVHKWSRSGSAIMFAMSNKDIQVVFFDTTEVVVSFTGQMVTYRDKHGILQSLPLSVAVHSPGSDLAMRMRYILSKLLRVSKEDLPASLQTGTDAHAQSMVHVGV